MKRLSVIIGILAVIVAGEIFGLTWTKNYTEELSSRLTALSEQTEDLLPRLEEIRQEWDDRRRILSLFLHERQLDHFEDTLIGAEDRIRTGGEDAALWLLTAAEAAEDIWKMERPTLQNIL